MSDSNPVPTGGLVVATEGRGAGSDFFSRLATDLERLALRVDTLDAEVEPITQRITSRAGRQMAGVGFIALAIKASALSAKLDRLVEVLRRNEARRWALRERH